MKIPAAADAELAIIEGQGSVVHPGSTSTLPLIRGSCPTHLVLCHRAGMTHLDTVGEPIAVPPLNDVITLYEDIANACSKGSPPLNVIPSMPSIELIHSASFSGDDNLLEACGCVKLL